MPKLWNDTIDGHRQTVRDAIIDATASLVAQRGLRAVTMLQIAESTGIGRATLYKYFGDADAILRAWHDRQIGQHLAALAEARLRGGAPRERVEAVLESYAFISRDSHGHHDADLATSLHRDERVVRAQQQVRRIIREVVADAAAAGEIRDDISPDELAGYCMHALGAARTLPSKTAVRRLVTVTLAGLTG